MPVVTYKGETYECLEGEPVLSALLRHGHNIPNSCRGGVCQSCMMKIESGTIPTTAQKSLNPTLAAQGYFLSCVYVPENDLVVKDPNEFPLVETRVIEIVPLSDSVIQIKLEPNSAFDWRAGQYVSVIRKDGLVRSYSVASLPESGFLELHVRVIAGGAMSEWMKNELRANEILSLKGPYGDCVYNCGGDPERPLLLAGTGTGLAPLVGILRDAIRNGHRGPITLFHGALNERGLYFQKELDRMAESVGHFRYHSCLLEGKAAGERTKIGRLDAHVIEHAESNPDCRAFLCGDPNLVGSMQMELFLAGLNSTEIFADAFVPSVNTGVA